MKGISPLLAGTMMIVGVIIISSIIGTWIISFSKTQKSTIQRQTEDKLSCLYASLYLDNFVLNCHNDCSLPTHNMTLVLKNSGSVGLYIEKFYLTNINGSLYGFEFNTTKSLYAGDWLNITQTFNTTCEALNNSIEKVTISSSNCPNKGYDTLNSNYVTYEQC